jgi:hypothetical protein
MVGSFEGEWMVVIRARVDAGFTAASHWAAQRERLSARRTRHDKLYLRRAL